MGDYLQPGHAMWEDHKNHYGIITARIMCISYLNMQAHKTDPDEQAFCREIREAMAAEGNMTGKPVYLKSWETAQRNGEAKLFDDSEWCNRLCAGEIDDAIKACEYGDGSYKLEPAAQALLDQYGAERLSLILAIEVRSGRDSFSDENRVWSDGFDIQSGFAGSGVRTHSEVLDEFITCFRETLDRTRTAEVTAPGSEAPYENGTDYWCDIKKVSVSLDAAFFVGGKYIEEHMRSIRTFGEIHFCYELFGAMYADKTVTANPAELVYSYDRDKAAERGETSYFQTSAKLNSDCAAAIDKVIHLSRYRPNHYNHDLAAMKAVHDFGFHRVNLVLAHNVRKNTEEYSAKNREWADGLGTHGEGFAGATLDTHPSLVDQFINHARELYKFVDADRFVLPGRAESGKTNAGYEIIRAIEFENNRGFAIGLNPNDGAQFVTWQFVVENSRRAFYQGNYSNDLADAAANYIARAQVHMIGENTREMQRPPAAEAPELNEAEQNFAAWMAVTESSRYRWVEDEIVRLNGRGAMYYTGGEDGIYIRVHTDGKLEAGDYEGAIPHIGEAFFKPAVTKQFDTYNEAYTRAMEAGGKQFMVDMFSGSEPQPLVHIVGSDTAEEKPSVLKQIRDAQKTPPAPRKPKEPRKSKNDIDL